MPGRLKTSVIFLTIASLSAGALWRWFAPKSVSPETQPVPNSILSSEPEVPHQRETLRRFAAYLEKERPAPLLSSSVPLATPPPQDSTLASSQRIEQIELLLSDRYSQFQSSEHLRRWVALRLTETDTDYAPEMSQNRQFNELMKDAPGTARQIEAALDSTPPTALAERAALVELAIRVGANPEATSTLIQALTIESQKDFSTLTSGGEDSRFAEEHAARLADGFFQLESNPERRRQFLDSSIEAQHRSPAAVQVFRNRSAFIQE